MIEVHHLLHIHKLSLPRHRFNNRRTREPYPLRHRSSIIQGGRPQHHHFSTVRTTEGRHHPRINNSWKAGARRLCPYILNPRTKTRGHLLHHHHIALPTIRTEPPPLLLPCMLDITLPSRLRQVTELTTTLLLLLLQMR
jgi:hypothetical protein